VWSRIWAAVCDEWHALHAEQYSVACPLRLTWEHAPKNDPSPYPCCTCCSKLMRVHAAVTGRHTRHGQLLPLEVYLEEGIPLVGGRMGVAGCRVG